jgi:hypothetical protein
MQAALCFPNCGVQGCDHSDVLGFFFAKKILIWHLPTMNGTNVSTAPSIFPPNVKLRQLQVQYSWLCVWRKILVGEFLNSLTFSLSLNFSRDPGDRIGVCWLLLGDLYMLEVAVGT